MQFPRQIQVNAITEEICKPVRSGLRKYFFAQNLSANDIYLNFGTHADINNGFTLGAGLFYERSRADNVTQDYIFVRGSVAGAALQNVQIIEG